MKLPPLVVVQSVGSAEALDAMPASALIETSAAAYVGPEHAMRFVAGVVRQKFVA